MNTYKEIMDRYMEEDYVFDRTFRNSKWHNVESYTPLKYRGIYEYIGYAYVWNDVGSIEQSFKMYRPVGSGTILYETY